MAKKQEADIKVKYKNKNVGRHGGAGGAWFLGFAGTLVYYLHFHSGSFKLVVLAFFKAVFWLAFLVYYLLQYMGI